MNNNTAEINNKSKKVKICFKNLIISFDFREFINDRIGFGIEDKAYILEWIKGADPRLDIYKFKKGIKDNVGLSLEIIKNGEYKIVK